MLPDFAQRSGIDLEQHRHDHQPDQRRDGQIDLRHGRIADDAEHTRDHLPQRDACNNAQRDSQCQEALEYAHGGPAGGRVTGRCGGFAHGQAGTWRAAVPDGRSTVNPRHIASMIAEPHKHAGMPPVCVRMPDNMMPISRPAALAA